MATINFYLKAPNKKDDCPIVMVYQDKGQKFKYHTRLRVKPKAWKDQRVKNNYIGFSEINGILDDIENSVKAIEREAVLAP